MHSYDTVTEALSDLKQRGFIYDFNLDNGRMQCKSLDRDFGEDELMIEETYRFEGPSDPADEAVVFALAAGDVRGTFVDGYGASYDDKSLDFLQHLHQRPVRPANR